MKLTAALGILSVAVRVAAWGKEGHMAVGYIAMKFLAPKALSFVQSSLGSTYDESLGPASTWADSVKRVHGYTWSRPYHYLDAHDDPLNGECSVDIARDCAKGDTLLNAISNYTIRVKDESLSDQQREEALKFLGFIGDIGQPLHLEAYEKGGNSIPTTCSGKSTELHATWDTGIIETMLKSKYGSVKDVEAWADDLAAAIQNGIYQSAASGWISCHSTTKPAPKKLQPDGFEAMAPKKTIAPLACPLVWARESNAYGCSAVFSYTEGDDLCEGTYFETAMPIIDEQIAKQGYRLAAWLNEIFDGTPMSRLDTGSLVEQNV